MLFRNQVVTLDDGRIMVADHATVQLQVGVQKAVEPTKASDEVQIDILATETADEYWSRSDMFNTSVDIAYTQPALDGLARSSKNGLRISFRYRHVLPQWLKSRMKRGHGILVLMLKQPRF